MTGPLQALAARYDRLATRGEAPAYGFSLEKISYAIILGLNGAVADLQPLLDTSGKKPQPTFRLVPQSSKRPGTEPKPFFLWDNTKFVLGVTKNKQNQAGVLLAPRHQEAFRAFHEQILADSDDPGLRALVNFLVSWETERFLQPMFQIDMLDSNLVFRLDGDLDGDGKPRFLHQRPAAREIWLEHLDVGESTRAMCMISGLSAPIARVHPAIKISGTRVANLSIVAFNQDAFTSYGKEQGDNAPISTAAAFAYTTMLNELARVGSRNIVRIGDATVVFWAETPEAEAIVRGLFDPPPPDEEGEAAVVRDVLAEMAKGRPIEQAAPAIDSATRFYVLGLSPNAARLSVRFWHETTFGELAERFQQHWEDLALDPLPGTPGPGVSRLIYHLSPTSQRMGKKPWEITSQPRLAKIAGDLTRAIVTGMPYPAVLLTENLIRFRTDQDVTDELTGRVVHRAMSQVRVSMIKACLVRHERVTARIVPMSATDVALHDRQAAQLGRLFALLERAQSAALGNINSNIRDKYYGSASSIPAVVFPFLLKNYRNHLSLLRKGRGASWIKKPKELAYWIDIQVSEVVARLENGWPTNLGYRDQGWFAIGYYKERYQRKDVPEDISATLEAEAADATDTSSED